MYIFRICEILMISGPLVQHTWFVGSLFGVYSVTYLSWAVGKSSTVDREYEARFFGSGHLRKSFDGRDGVCEI